MKKMIDANVILRYLLNDNKEMADQAEQVILDLIYIENKDIIKSALTLYGQSTLDFPDCILISYNWIRSQLVFSFDKKLNRELQIIQ